MFIVDKLLNFITGKKNCIKKNLKAITGNLIQSWQSFTCTLFCLVRIHFSQTFLYSLLEFGNVFGRPVLFIDFSLQIRPEIFNWARFWRCWIKNFWWINKNVRFRYLYKKGQISTIILTYKHMRSHEGLSRENILTFTIIF